MSRLVAAIASRQWAMSSDHLQTMIEIASRENEPIEVIEARLGKKLDNTQKTTMRGSVAVVPVIGPLFRYANLLGDISGATSYQMIAKDFTAALDNDEVAGIVLNIDSPGGDASGCQELADLIYAGRRKKPVVAYVGGMACSGGYWLASACKRVVAAETAVVGSIGVCQTMMDTTEADKAAGVRVRQIVSTNAPRKNMGANGITDEAENALRTLLTSLESVFIDRVARNRNTSIRKVRSDFGRGGVLVAGAGADDQPTGLEAGLVDEIGTFEGLIARMNADDFSIEEDVPLFKPRGAQSDPAPAIIEPTPAAASVGQPAPAAEDEPMSAEIQTALTALTSSVAAMDAKIATLSAPPPPALVAEQSPEVTEMLALTGAADLSAAVAVVRTLKASSAEVEGIKAQFAALKSAEHERDVRLYVDGLLRPTAGAPKIVPGQVEGLVKLGVKDFDSLKAVAGTLPELAHLAIETPGVSAPGVALTAEMADMARKMGNDPNKVVDFAAAHAARR